MKLTGTVIRLAAVASVQLLFTAVIVVVFGQVRFDRTNTYSAEFSNASGLRAGQFVRASGVEVGKVKKVDLVEGDKRIRVDFSVDRSVQLYQSTTAEIRYQDLIGNRYLEVSRGTGEGAERALPPGGFIPLSRTEPALDLDALIGGFKPLFRALDPQKVNTIASSIITGPCCMTPSVAWRTSPRPWSSSTTRSATWWGRCPRRSTSSDVPAASTATSSTSISATSRSRSTDFSRVARFVRSSCGRSRQVGARCNESAATCQPGACRGICHRCGGARCRCGAEL
jgi:hypothetical protein